jgi:hypothetical protein
MISCVGRCFSQLCLSHRRGFDRATLPLTRTSLCGTHAIAVCGRCLCIFFACAYARILLLNNPDDSALVTCTSSHQKSRQSPRQCPHKRDSSRYFVQMLRCFSWISICSHVLRVLKSFMHTSQGSKRSAICDQIPRVFILSGRVNLFRREISSAAYYFGDSRLIDSDLLFDKSLHENPVFLPMGW